MKNYLKATLIAAGVLTFASLPASADSLTFQGLTFTFTSPGANQLELTITDGTNDGVLTPTGDWSGVGFLAAFAVKPDSNNFLSATITSSPSTSWTVHDDTNLNASSGFCSGGGNGFECFSANPPLALTVDSLTFDITFTGVFGSPSPLDLNSAILKIAFLTNANDTSKTGSLLSESIVVPGPIVGAGLPGLIFACGGLLGLARHRRRKLG
jgi:hypothetical protein